MASAGCSTAARCRSQTAAISAYFVVNSTVTDPAELASYREAVRATFDGHDVTVLVSTNEADAVEGQPRGERLVVLRFPDRDAFHAWYKSPAYQAIIGLRLASTDGFAVLADGRD
jgi:uncharacterized protein (DUF1330 family)